LQRAEDAGGHVGQRPPGEDQPVLLSIEQSELSLVGCTRAVWWLPKTSSSLSPPAAPLAAPGPRPPARRHARPHAAPRPWETVTEDCFAAYVPRRGVPLSLCCACLCSCLCLYLAVLPPLSSPLSHSIPSGGGAGRTPSASKSRAAQTPAAGHSAPS
jgi:hypothetical protein